MDIADLKTLAAVARHGSMNKAASELNTVQSNVTARIRALEEELGLPLFQRHARGVTITSAGRRLLPFVGRITKLIDEAYTAAKDEGKPGGTLVLGGLETTMALRLSPLFPAFASAYPDVRLIVNAGTSARLVDDVLECRLDGAFVAGPINHPDLYQEPIFQEELVVATSPLIPSLKALTKIGDLKTIVFQRGCSYRQRLENLLTGMGIVLAKPLEFGSLDAIVGCVSAGVGVTLLPKGVVAPFAATGKLAMHALPKEQARVETLFIRRTDSYVSSAMTAFLDMARGVQHMPRTSGPRPLRRRGPSLRPSGSGSPGRATAQRPP